VNLIGPRRKSLDDCFQAMSITGRANLERQKSTQLSRFRRVLRAAGMGHFSPIAAPATRGSRARTQALADEPPFGRRLCPAARVQGRPAAAAFASRVIAAEA
jgi:hypothetical protein